jgi:hypothetical protein
MDNFHELEACNREVESAQKYCVEVSEKCQTLPKDHLRGEYNECEDIARLYRKVSDELGWMNPYLGEPIRRMNRCHELERTMREKCSFHVPSQIIWRDIDSVFSRRKPLLDEAGEPAVLKWIDQKILDVQNEKLIEKKLERERILESLGISEEQLARIKAEGNKRT